MMEMDVDVDVDDFTPEQKMFIELCSTGGERIEKSEWRAFFAGLQPSARLIFNMLHYRYSLQHTIRVVLQRRQDIRTGYTHYLNSPLQAEDSIDYELVVLSHSYVAPDDSTWPVISLLVRRRSPQYNNILFTVPDSDFYNERENNNNDNLTYVLNDRYEPYVKYDNAYAFLHFLDAFFTGTVFVSKQPFYGVGVVGAPSVLQYVDTLIIDITRPHRVNDALLTLYNDMKELLSAISREGEDNMKNNRYRSTEQKKVLFYALVQSVLAKTLVEPIVSNTLLSTVPFFELEILDRRDDPMDTKGEMQHSDDLFRELLLMLTFLMRAVHVAQIPGDLTRMRVDENNEYTKEMVELHVKHLLFRLLNNVDNHNIDTRISPAQTISLRFNGDDYEALIEHGRITYNVLCTLFNDEKLDDILILGQSHLDHLLVEEEEEEKKKKKNSDTMKVTTIQIEDEDNVKNKEIEDYEVKVDAYTPERIYTKSLKATIENKKIVFCVTEMRGNTCLFIIKREGSYGITRNRCMLYTPGSMSIEDQLQLYDFYKLKIIPKLLTETSYFRSISSVAKEATTSGCYVAFIMRRLINDVDKSLANSQIETYINELTRDQLLQFIRLVKINTRRAINKTIIYGKKRFHEPATDDDYAANIDVKSRISDLAKLGDPSLFITDPVISDMLTLFVLKPGCYCYDASFWQGLEKMGRMNKLRVFSTFADPSINLIFLPINQSNTHWSLAIIDLTMGNAHYYSSIKDDPYYSTTFSKLVTSFLQIQSPSTTFTVVRHHGPLQPKGNYDCAVFVLNMVSSLATRQNVFYTRDTVERSLSALLLLEVQRKDSLLFLHDDLLLRYFDRVPADQAQKTKSRNKVSISGSGIWSSVKNDSKKLEAYRARYIVQLDILLSDTHLYTLKSIASFLRLIKKNLRRIKKDTLSDNMASLFNTLTLIGGDDDDEKIDLDKRGKKRVRLVIESTRDADQDEARAIKSRACLKTRSNMRKYAAALREKIDTHEKYQSTKDGIVKFKRDFITALRDALAPYLKLSDQLDAFTNAFVDALYDTVGWQGAIDVVLQKYAICKKGDEEEEEVPIIKASTEPITNAPSKSLDKMRRLRGRALEVITVSEKERFGGKGGLEIFKDVFGNSIRRQLADHVKDDDRLDAFADAFMTAFYALDPIQATEEVMKKYAKKEEEKNLKCFYCDNETSLVDLHTQRVYCSLECRISDKINFS